MDTQEFKKMVLKLGEMSSKHAADWLVLTYPVGSAGYGSAIALITHRSWKRSDQIRLAKHYLSKLPFASVVKIFVVATEPNCSRTRLLHH